MSLSTASRRALQRLLPLRTSTSVASTYSFPLQNVFSSSTTNTDRDEQRRNFQTPPPSPAGDVIVAPVPTLKVAHAMPVGMSEMSNEMLVTIAAMGHHEAHCEVLKRHVMSVDDVEYEKASNVYEEIAAKNRGAVNLAVYPYFIGIGAAMLGAFGSLPMVFDLNMAVWFNEFYVTTDIPEQKDLETMLEVGSWTWNWMEPPLGTFSFSLLCLQFAR